MSDIHAILEGDERAWNAFVARYAPLIHTVVRRTLRAHGAWLETTDVVQEIFVRLLEDDARLLRRFDAKRASLRTWLSIVTRSRTIDLLRRKQLATVSLQDAPEPAVPTPVAHDAGPDLPMELLTGRQKLVLHLLYDRELAVREVARALNITEQSVRSTRHKALTRLRRHFDETGDD